MKRKYKIWLLAVSTAIFTITPHFFYGQSIAPENGCSNVMGKFMQFYNNKQLDSIKSMFTNIRAVQYSSFCRQPSFDSIFNHYGKMEHYKYDGEGYIDCENGFDIHYCSFEIEFPKMIIKSYLSLDDHNKHKLREIVFGRTSPEVIIETVTIDEAMDK